MPVLKKKKPKAQEPREPLWKGPLEDGITQSMLGDFLVCRERFRLKYVEGYEPSADEFKHSLEYGSMWHTCEEAHAEGEDWHAALFEYAGTLMKAYPLQQADVLHWANVCAVQFPVYANHWARHPDVQKRTNLMSEEVFKVPYVLPSGREVILRGRWDNVDLIKEPPVGVYLQENKTKGDPREEQIQQQLLFDLQTGVYMTALHAYDSKWPAPIRGVRYNVIRRPLAGGKHSIRQKKGQTLEEFYAELGERIASDVEFFFVRWRVEMSSGDLKKFKRCFLNPILEQLCIWYDAISHEGVDVFRRAETYLHWQHPYGVYNPMDRGRSTEYDEFLATGSTAGLVRRESLFTEL